MSGRPGVLASRQVLEPIICNLEGNSLYGVQVRVTESLKYCVTHHLELYGSRPR